MDQQILTKQVAILAADGFEQAELEEPMKALIDAGATVSIISPNKHEIQAMRHADKGDCFGVDLNLEKANPDDFDALMLPGGLMNPDTLRSTPAAVDFVRSFGKAGKPIAAICHGPWLLIEADLVRGRRLTSWPAIKTDIRNAGGDWVDEEVVVDNGMVTSRNPGDIPAFNAKMIDAARWLATRRLLGVWKQPTDIHLISKEDFCEACAAAIENPNANGIYHIGDEGKITLQELLTLACNQWGYPPPWRMPLWMIYSAAGLCEIYSGITGSPSPLTRDFIDIGRVTYYGNTERFREDLLPTIKYRTILEGLHTL
jgi:protease I